MPEKSIKLKSKAKPVPNPLIVRFVVLFVFIIIANLCEGNGNERAVL
jgi:hypothetical protein